jgi:hypothetical protein
MDKDTREMILAHGCSIKIESRAPGEAFASLFVRNISPNADPFEKSHVRKILKSMSALMGDDDEN